MIRRSLPFDAWPEADRIAWTQALAEGDILDGRGPAAHWAPTTRYSVKAAYGRYLAFLSLSELSALAEHPTGRLTQDRLARYLDHLAQTAGTMGQHMFFAKLRDAMRVMFPGSLPKHLSRFVARLESECRPSSRAARIVTSTRLAALGTKLMEEATDAAGDIIDAVASRRIDDRTPRPTPLTPPDLFTCPGRHAFAERGKEWRLVFEGPETKSGRPFEITVPQKLVRSLEYYLREVRPKFTGADRHDGVWVSTKGRALTANAIARVITERTREAFGQSVNPHLFRHCAATTIAILQPGRIGVARDLLGYASLATTNAYYNKARAIDASRLYAGVLTGLTVSVHACGGFSDRSAV
jgi:integrase/recombinase XerD